MIFYNLPFYIFFNHARNDCYVENHLREISNCTAFKSFFTGVINFSILLLSILLEPFV